MKNKQLKIRLHPIVHKELKVAAAEQGHSINYVVTQALREFLIKHGHEKIVNLEENDE